MSGSAGALLRVLQLILIWLPVIIELVVQVLAAWAAFCAAKEAAFPKSNQSTRTPVKPLLLKWSQPSS